MDQWNPRLSPAANARRYLPELVNVWLAEAHKILARPDDPVRLHRLRLISKRLRYTLELFGPRHCEGLPIGIETLKHFQDLLGEANDAAVAARLIAKLPGSMRMRYRLQRIAAERTAAFHSEWRKRFEKLDVS
jgi:CHAD domain-containing protein